MKICIDKDCKCHTVNDGTMREIDVPFFDGKCPAYIEGYRYVPQGESWTRADGEVFTGEMISPAVDSRVLEAYQRQYEDMLAEIQVREQALEIVGVTADD